MNACRVLLFSTLFAMGLSFVGPVCAQSVSSRLEEANHLFRDGQTEEARKVYEVVVSMDSSCYEALAWLGNYYYLKGLEALTETENTYQAWREPTRMQLARYQNALRSVYWNWYAPSEVFLQKALDVRKNEHLQRLLDDVERYKQRIGVTKPMVKTSRLYGRKRTSLN